MEVKVAKLTLHLTNVAEIDVSPRSSSLRTFRAEERLRLSDRNSILMTQINVYKINPVVMGFQI